MIKIRLLGGANKGLGGRAFINYEKPAATVSEILLFLHANATEPRLLDPVNLIVAVNGVDSAAIAGKETIARSGDTVTIVTVVHGGSSHLICRTHVAIIGTERVENNNIGKLVDSTRQNCGSVSVQVLNARCVFGEEHIIEVIRVALEAQKRNIMIADKVETELLIRVAFTDQISEALLLAGMKTGDPSCFVGFSEIPGEVNRFADYIAQNFRINQNVLARDSGKKKLLATRLGIPESYGDDVILQSLLERGALLAM